MVLNFNTYQYFTKIRFSSETLIKLEDSNNIWVTKVKSEAEKYYKEGMMPDIKSVLMSDGTYMRLWADKKLAEKFTNFAKKISKQHTIEIVDVQIGHINDLNNY